MVAHSQTKYSIDDSVKRHKWEIYLNVAPILKLPAPNWSYPFLVKRNVGKGSNLGAWRFMIAPYLNNIQDQDPFKIIYSTTDNTYFNAQVLFGYEKQRVIGRFCYYYGLDLHFLYNLQRSKSEDRKQMPPDGEKVGLLVSNDQNTSYCVSPFVGVKYSFNQRLAVSLESKIDFRYGVLVSKKIFEGEEFFRRQTSWREIAYQPMYAFNLSYHF